MPVEVIPILALVVMFVAATVLPVNMGALGFGAVRLLTNNPAKVARMEEAGIRVAERVPLRVGLNDQNAAYLATKVAKSGHLL